MNYECDICHKSFIVKRNYNRHINNPNLHIKFKEPGTKYICNCGNVYLHNSSLTSHKRKCFFIPDDPQSDNSIRNELLLQTQFQKEKEELLKQFELEKEELLKQVELEKQELLKQVETEKLRNTNNIDTQNIDTLNIDTQNNLNIQINAFGCENLEHITDTFKVKCLKQIYKSIPEMVIKIHFNTKYPENLNVKIPNKKLPYASIMTKDNTWKTVDKKNTITSMVDKSFNMLDDTYEEHKGELSETKRKNYEKYQEKYWKNDKQLHKQLETDVECLVLDGTR
jgi:hypothetical protein